jgi:hypothetical protein
MSIMRAPVLRVLALAKDEASKEPEQHWECTIDPTEVWLPTVPTSVLSSQAQFVQWLAYEFSIQQATDAILTVTSNS